MARFTKLSVQVPEVVREQYMDLEYGYKRLACTSGLIMYFNADEDTQRLYRAWAQAIAEGYATIEEPPAMVKGVLEKKEVRPGDLLELIDDPPKPARKQKKKTKKKA